MRKPGPKPTQGSHISRPSNEPLGVLRSLRWTTARDRPQGPAGVRVGSLASLQGSLGVKWCQHAQTKASPPATDQVASQTVVSDSRTQDKTIAASRWSHPQAPGPPAPSRDLQHGCREAHGRAKGDRSPKPGVSRLAHRVSAHISGRGAIVLLTKRRAMAWSRSYDVVHP